MNTPSPPKRRQRRKAAAPRQEQVEALPQTEAPITGTTVATPRLEQIEAVPATDASITGPLQRFMDRLGIEPGMHLAPTGVTAVGAGDAAPSDPAMAPPAREAPPVAYPLQVAAGPVAAMRPRVGEILTAAKRMTIANVGPVLKQQSQAGGRFGEIAVAMGVVDASDLLWALSQQSGTPRERTGVLVGAHHDLIVAREPMGAPARFIRDLCSQLLEGVLNRESTPRRALAVVSVDVADGKTYLAANLALSLAQLGRRTILVDADLRTPRIQSVFGVPDPVRGLGAVLGGSELLRDAIVSLPDLPSLHLLAAGPSRQNPLELFLQPAATVLVQTLIREYEHVIVDTPAMQAGADTSVIAQSCGAAMIVGRKGRSRMDDVKALILQLQKSGVSLAGLVMNRH